MKFHHFILLIFILLFSCTGIKRESDPDRDKIKIIPVLSDEFSLLSENDTITGSFPGATVPGSPLADTIIDSYYSFTEAVAGSDAPQEIISQLELIEVFYLSTDEKIHKGQILTNRSIAKDITEIFDFMLQENFVIEKAIPIVKYGWDDSLSMEANNSYSFCFRNTSYSKHAYGLAIDINPRFNPLRWKVSDHPNKPAGAVLDTTVNGTLYPGHPVVTEFRKRDFRWGHTFTKYYDDHHFEKR